MLKLNRFFFDQAISIDNALTTNQIIHQIIKQVKEVVDYVNSLETDAHEYTDAKVLELKTQLEHQISDLETFLKGYADTKLVDAKDYTDSEIANLRLNYIDVKVSEIYATITALESRLDAKIDYTDAKLTNLIDSVKSELIELIKKGGAIYSGVTGERTNPEVVTKQIVDKVQHKNGMSWNNIINLIMTQTPPSAELRQVDKLSMPVGDEKVYVSKKIFNMLFNPYSDNPYVYLSYEGSIQTYIGASIQATNVDNKFFSVRINGEPLPMSTQRVTGSSDTEFSNTVFIPLYRKVNNDYEFSYFNNKWNVRQLKRINALQIVTSTGIYNTFIFVDDANLPFKNVTWNDVITSCNTNKNYNTWDALTYYTIKFMGEHLCTADYSIPIDSEFEEVASGNAIPSEVSFYHNKL